MSHSLVGSLASLESDSVLGPPVLPARRPSSFAGQGSEGPAKWIILRWLLNLSLSVSLLDAFKSVYMFCGARWFLLKTLRAGLTYQTPLPFTSCAVKPLHFPQRSVIAQDCNRTVLHGRDLHNLPFFHVVSLLIHCLTRFEPDMNYHLSPGEWEFVPLWQGRLPCLLIRGDISAIFIVGHDRLSLT